MLERIYHWLSGYVEFRVRGDGARLFSMAAKRGLGLWGFCREGKLLGARIKPREYKKLRPLCRRCGAVGRIVKKRGLPFEAARLWERKGLILGAMLGAGLYWFLSGFIWGVSVEGTGRLLPDEVLRAAEDCGVYVGAGREKARAGDPEVRMQGMLPELSWVTVNTDGCFAQVVVKERTEKPQMERHKELSNIVAARAGRIVKIAAMEGRPEVRQGDTVSEGQLLIAGLYREETDPWDPNPPEPYKVAGAARGSVIAETYREFTVQVSAAQREPVEAGRDSALWLHAFGVEIPLGFQELAGDRYRAGEDRRCWEESRSLRVLGVELPIGLTRRTSVQLTEEQRALTGEQQRAAALMKLREAQRAELPEGSSIRQEELDFTFTEGACVLSARCRCWEEIGVAQKILVE